MIIRVPYVAKEFKKLQTWVGGATVFGPIATLTDYAMFAKILVDEDDDGEAIKQSLTGVGLTIAEVAPRVVIVDGPGRLDETARTALAQKFYFIAHGDRGSFIFTRKDFYDANDRRIDGSFLGNTDLEAALPAGFSNHGEPEWYIGDCEVNDKSWLDAYDALLALGFTELDYDVDAKKYLVKDTDAQRKAGSNYYFFAEDDEDYMSYFITLKSVWDADGGLEDGSSEDDSPFDIARPLGIHNAAENEWHYRDCQESKRDFKIGRRLLLAAGFTERPVSEIK